MKTDPNVKNPSYPRQDPRGGTPPLRTAGGEIAPGRQESAADRPDFETFDVQIDGPGGYSGFVAFLEQAWDDGFRRWPDHVPPGISGYEYRVYLSEVYSRPACRPWDRFRFVLELDFRWELKRLTIILRYRLRALFNKNATPPPTKDEVKP